MLLAKKGADRQFELTHMCTLSRFSPYDVHLFLLRYLLCKT